MAELVKTCRKCGKDKPATDEFFGRSRRSKDKFEYSCRTCRNAVTNAYHRRFRAANRIAALVHYSAGEPKCACCAEKRLPFLSIDHIDGGGSAHKRSIGNGGGALSRWLKNNNYPAGFQILCHNCNQAKGYYGKCPHAEEVLHS